MTKSHLWKKKHKNVWMHNCTLPIEAAYAKLVHRRACRLCYFNFNFLSLVWKGIIDERTIGVLHWYSHCHSFQPIQFSFCFEIKKKLIPHSEAVLPHFFIFLSSIFMFSIVFNSFCIQIAFNTLQSHPRLYTVLFIVSDFT